MTSIYSPEVRKEADRAGITDLQAYYKVQARNRINAEMSERFRAQMELARRGEVLAYQAGNDDDRNAAPIRRKSLVSRLWDRIENYFADRFIYS